MLEGKVAVIATKPTRLAWKTDDRDDCKGWRPRVGAGWRR
jgi:hypothetical protein